MTILFLITASLIALYFIYPFWLMTFSASKPENEYDEEYVNSISLVLLSYNGRQYLEEKINFLLEELSVFKHYELIIVDDHSTDGSQEILDHLVNRKNILVIRKKEHKGIPHTMNLAVENAKYKHIVFCDQRQHLSRNIIQRIAEPLKYKDTGAVSACISDLDKENCCSKMRMFENFIKLKESKTGNLIGVYGPLYAVKKECYAVIPEYIVLDDLYLSLKILGSKHIKILEECRIIDDGISVLYDYNRARRYVFGFFQLLREKSLFNQLNARQMIMLFWHKYLRLLIPLFLFLSYTCLGIMATAHASYLILFGCITTAGLLSALPGIFKVQVWLKNIIRINLFYFLALFDVLIGQFFSRDISANDYI